MPPFLICLGVAYNFTTPNQGSTRNVLGLPIVSENRTNSNPFHRHSGMQLLHPSSWLTLRKSTAVRGYKLPESTSGFWKTKERPGLWLCHNIGCYVALYKPTYTCDSATEQPFGYRHSYACRDHKHNSLSILGLI